MPEVNGLDMTGRIRERNRSASIIILSGYSDFGFAKRAIELGVYRYLTKPTRMGELLSALEEISWE